ncbi:Aste57867_10288 [Aphanomyces stellatus]|uniref:Aste57867_10288 protein n=1 Tax=Aphanomyces stellatus TaxID=120398 RepID=A0A485KQH5_9STRA|nr:hypothetical protein As57867_010248 [Aphanomyces stellatus]VFT87162.1 Aste57867_10288 [Aphanomyces stellatus]
MTNTLNDTDTPKCMALLLKKDFNLRNGCEIIVEACPSLSSASVATEWVKANAHLIPIQVTCKDETILSRKNDPAVGTKDGAMWSFVVDHRTNFQELKDLLAKFINMPAKTFKLYHKKCVYLSEVEELKALDLPLYKLSLRTIRRSVWLQDDPSPSTSTTSRSSEAYKSTTVQKMRVAIAKEFARRKLETTQFLGTTAGKYTWIYVQLLLVSSIRNPAISFDVEYVDLVVLCQLRPASRSCLGCFGTALTRAASVPPAGSQPSIEASSVTFTTNGESNGTSVLQLKLYASYCATYTFEMVPVVNAFDDFANMRDMKKETAQLQRHED